MYRILTIIPKLIAATGPIASSTIGLLAFLFRRSNPITQKYPIPGAIFSDAIAPPTNKATSRTLFIAVRICSPISRIPGNLSNPLATNANN